MPQTVTCSAYILGMLVKQGRERCTSHGAVTGPKGSPGDSDCVMCSDGQSFVTYAIPLASNEHVMVGEPIIAPPRHVTLQVPFTPTKLQLDVLTPGALIWPHAEQKLGRPWGSTSLCSDDEFGQG